MSAEPTYNAKLMLREPRRGYIWVGLRVMCSECELPMGRVDWKVDGVVYVTCPKCGYKTRLIIDIDEEPNE